MPILTGVRWNQGTDGLSRAEAQMSQPGERGGAQETSRGGGEMWDHILGGWWWGDTDITEGP